MKRGMVNGDRLFVKIEISEMFLKTDKMGDCIGIVTRTPCKIHVLFINNV